MILELRIYPDNHRVPCLRIYSSWRVSDNNITNQGYKKSGIPIRAKIHCYEETNIDEVADFEKTPVLKVFHNLKGSIRELRDTADAAVLFVMFGNYAFECGQGHVGDYEATISWVRKDCAVHKFSFGHEIGHNIGCLHNKRMYPEEYRYGYQFEDDGAGYHTIMAHSSDRYPNRVNSY